MSDGSDWGDGSDGGGISHRVVYWHSQFIVTSAVTYVLVGDIQGESNRDRTARCTEHKCMGTTFGKNTW